MRTSTIFNMLPRNKNSAVREIFEDNGFWLVLSDGWVSGSGQDRIRCGGDGASEEETLEALRHQIAEIHRK